MKWVLIGHRGVGKTQLLNRFKVYFKNSKLSFVDLDQEIENKYRTPLTELFPQLGEAQFRQVEQQIFHEILEHHAEFILSVGAGFVIDPEKLAAQDVKVIWVRRKTDELGRIFLNRPRLNTQVSPLEEFKERYVTRQRSYQTSAEEVYWIPEGIDGTNAVEEKIFSQQEKLFTQGLLTLMPWHYKNAQWDCLRYECEYYEIRDDFLKPSDQALLQIPLAKRWLSFRNPNSIQTSLKLLAQVSASDWALELGPCPSSDISTVSCHERLEGENLDSFLLRLEMASLPQQHLKAAPVIDSFAEAVALLRWQEQEPQRRSVLPRSTNTEKGRWLWLRLFLKGRQKINFWRDSEGSSTDQPTLFEWLSTSDLTNSFAALLGNPVLHSRTMVEQAEFFVEKNCPVWPILLLENEFSEALRFLMERGLKAAAVTSPLKKLAFDHCQRTTKQAQDLQAVNTLEVRYENGKKILWGHNTDLLGFQKLMEKAAVVLPTQLSQATAVVWGGGGTLSVVQMVLPQAIQISVRSRQPRNSAELLSPHVNILVWAAGPEESFPPEFDFDILVDLNYREDSRGREWAIIKGKRYLGGDEMFKAQALGQRDFWSLAK